MPNLTLRVSAYSRDGVKERDKMSIIPLCTVISEGKGVSVGVCACMPLINQIKSNSSIVDSHFMHESD